MKNKIKFARFVSSIVGLVVILSVLLSFASCGASGNKADFMPEAGYDGGYNSGSSDNSMKEDIELGTSGDVISDTRYVIKTVNASIATEKYDELISAIKNKVSDLGGYFSNANYVDNSYSNIKSRSARFTLKIPAENLDSFTSSIESLGSFTSYNEHVDDVTAEYIDVDSRISVLEAEEVTLLAMLEKTESIDDMLTVRSHLQNVQSELASLKARKENLASSIAFSTIYLNVNERSIVEPKAEAGFFERVGSTFLTSIRDIVGGFGDFGVWILGNSPYLVIISAAGVAVFFLVRFIVRKRKNKDGE